jgi:hypothetical protein
VQTNRDSLTVAAGLHCQKMEVIDTVSTASPTPTMTRQTRPLDPLIIGSFPAPPTHIPSTTNPPPSRPPSVPLPPVPHHGHDSDDDLLHLALSGTTLPTKKLRHVANESISSIDMRDLMFDDENIYADSLDPPLPTNSPTLADPIDPQTLHLQIRTARSKSKQHRQMLRSRSASRPGSPVSLPPSQPLPPIPGSKITVLNENVMQPLVPSPPSPPRSASPDIEAIISTTTRPQRSKSQSRARTSVASTSSLTKSTSSEAKRRASEGVVHSSRSARGRRSILSTYSEGAVERSELPYVRPRPYLDGDDDSRSWIEPDEFGINQSPSPSSVVTPDHQSFGTNDEEREREARLERALEGAGSDSDSSLDIHTPLPSVYIHAIILSPALIILS